MKIRYYGALTSAFLLTLSASPVEAHDCACKCPPKPVHHAAARPAPAHVVHYATVRPAPAHIVREDADAEYAQSTYDYHSSSTVSEVPEGREDDYRAHHEHGHGHWRVAPNDGEVEFQTYYYTVPLPPVVTYGQGAYAGGVGGGYAGAYAGGYQDGYGQMHFAPGPNGPTYNTYGESIQNGGFAEGGFGPERRGDWHGYNMRGGIGNGY